MKLLTWCRVIGLGVFFGSGRAGHGLGLGLKFVKIFRACIQNVFRTLRVMIFVFRDVDLLCTPR